MVSSHNGHAKDFDPPYVNLLTLKKMQEELNDIEAIKSLALNKQNTSPMKENLKNKNEVAHITTPIEINSYKISVDAKTDPNRSTKGDL